MFITRFLSFFSWQSIYKIAILFKIINFINWLCQQYYKLWIFLITISDIENCFCQKFFRQTTQCDVKAGSDTTCDEMEIDFQLFWWQNAISKQLSGSIGQITSFIGFPDTRLLWVAEKMSNSISLNCLASISA